MCSSLDPFVDGDGGRDALSIGLFRSLELRGLVGTTSCRAGPLKRPTLARTRSERFGFRHLKVIP